MGVLSQLLLQLLCGEIQNGAGLMCYDYLSSIISNYRSCVSFPEDSNKATPFVIFTQHYTLFISDEVAGVVFHARFLIPLIKLKPWPIDLL